MRKKSILFSKHALEQLGYRGATREEATATIRTGLWAPTELGRMESRKNFRYRKTWNGKYYETKQVRPIFVEETKEIVVVTVYVYYF